MTAPAMVRAADSYQVPYGSTVTIDEHGECRQVTNNHASGLATFVATKTANEWSTGAGAFLNALPPGVSAATCPPTCSGASVGGYCWYLAAATGSGISCDSVCSSHGGCNNAGQTSYAWLNLANCNAVVTALQGAGSAADSNASYIWAEQAGCIAVTTPAAIRFTDETPTCSGTVTAPNYRRVCSCNN